VLVDNTIGKIYTNVSQTSGATAANIIAGTALKSATIQPIRSTTGPVSCTVAINLSGGGIAFATAGLLTRVTLSAVTAPTGKSIIVLLKTGAAAYTSLTTVASVQLGTNATTATANTAPFPINIAAGQYLYFDISQVGTVSPGAGLTIRVDYYLG
jgi:hypothetical protein